MFTVPDWAFEFHGHVCPFMPLGYRAGQLAMQELGVPREKDHGLFAFSEMGEGHPNTCFEDGIQVASGATYAKRLLRNLNYGKAALVLYHPQKGAVRVAVRPEAIGKLREFEFVKLRAQGKEPSAIPTAVGAEIVNWVTSQDDAMLFAVQPLPDFSFTPPQTLFPMARCSACGEMVFSSYLRIKDGQPLCIPCSGYGK
jgi:formylmethanofuran dehydrogenase subunit E